MLVTVSLFLFESNSYSSFHEKNNQKNTTKIMPQEKEIPSKIKGQFQKTYTKKKIPMMNFTTKIINVIIFFIRK